MKKRLLKADLRTAAVIALAAYLGGCSADGDPGTLVVTTPTSTSLPTIDLQISPQAVRVGEPAKATWQTTGATTCAANGSWSGPVALSNTIGVNLDVAASGIFTYGVSCTGPGGKTATHEILIVGDVPTPGIEFSLSPQAIRPGDAATLRWSTTHATSCSGSGGTGSEGWAAAQPLSNEPGFSTGAISAAGDYTYNLSCTGPGGSSEESRVLRVDTSSPPAPPFITFAALPTFIQPGQSTTLSWATSNATSCTASGGTGVDGWNGTQPTSSAGTTTGPIAIVGNFAYTLTCAGTGGIAAESVNVLVSSAPQPPPVTVSLGINATHIVAGGSAELTWTSTNADTCMASGSWSGSKPLSGTGVSTGTLSTPGVYSFTLTCEGAGGIATEIATTTLTVNPLPAVIASFAATPTAIQSGSSISLQWQSSGATACTASGGSGADNWSGAQPTSSSGLNIGPVNVLGTHTYTLTCTGPGGTSAPSSAVVAVTSAPPPASINVFSASPTTLLTGQSTVLSWTSSAATSCTASGGTGFDGWTGAVPTSNVGMTIGPFTVPGTYTYTLTCSGVGGVSAPSSIPITVTAAAPPATITSLTATPSSVSTGQSVMLSWSTSNATSCTATGGAGADGWNGAMPTFSAATAVGPLAAVGTYNYTLTCTGSGGASAPSSTTVTVNAPVPGQPTVALLINNASSAQIQPGQAPTLTWSTTNATACTASAGTGTDGWSGTQPTSNMGITLGAINTPGIYAYTLTCTGAGGTGSGTVLLTVIASPSADCGIGEPSTMLMAPAASASSSVQGLCLVGCGVSNISHLTDAVPNNFATLSVALGVAAQVSLKVKDNTTIYPSGRKVGFLVAHPSSLLSAAVLQNVSLKTLLGNTVQQSATISDLLNVTLLGAPSDPNEAFLNFVTTKPFDSVRLDVNSLASVLSQFRVYGACASLQ